MVCAEVWLIRNRGRYPSWTAWWDTENAPVMTAWEAMTVAAVASSTIGSRPHSGTSRKNGLLIAPAGSSRTSAPCPR